MDLPLFQSSYIFCVCRTAVFQVVGPTNELVEAKLQLKVETQRILSQMTLKARLAQETDTMHLICAVRNPSSFVRTQV